jgi:hypothetical protein
LSQSHFLMATDRLTFGADDAPPLHDQLSALHDAHHAACAGILRTWP